MREILESSVIADLRIFSLICRRRAALLLEEGKVQCGAKMGLTVLRSGMTAELAM